MKLYTPSSDDGSYFPTSIPAPPHLMNTFSDISGGDQICLAWAYLLLFLTGNQNPGLSRERGKHP